MRVVKIHSRIRDYKVTFGRFDHFLNTIIKEEGGRACYVIDKKVWDLYKGTYFKRLDHADVILIKADEFNK